MAQTLTSMRSLFLSMTLLMLGHGLQLTLVPLRAVDAGFAAHAIGLTLTAYFVGYIVGCMTLPGLIGRVGHIRVHATCTVVAAAALLLLVQVEQPLAWALFRGAMGWSLAGIYMTIESWLAESVALERRGRTLSIYAALVVGCMTSAQVVIGLGLPASEAALTMAAVLIVLAVVPVALTDTAQPAPPALLRLRPAELFRAAPVAPVATLVHGAVMSTLWGLSSVVAVHHLDASAAGTLVLALLIGGTVSQLLVSAVVDRVDRERLVAGLMVIGAVGAALPLLLGPGIWSLTLAMALCGAATQPLHALAVTLATRGEPGRAVTMSGGLLVANSIGAAVAPLLLTQLVGDAITAPMFGGAALLFGGGLCWTLLAPRCWQPAPQVPVADVIELDQWRDADAAGSHTGEAAGTGIRAA